jgi:hypothetical protein
MCAARVFMCAGASVLIVINVCGACTLTEPFLAPQPSKPDEDDMISIPRLAKPASPSLWSRFSSLFTSMAETAWPTVYYYTAVNR